MNYISLYFQFIRLYLQRIFQYRTDFFLGFAANLGRSGIGLALVWVIFANLKTFNSWTYSEVMAIYGISIIVTSLTGIFSASLYRLGPEYIIHGQLDLVLLRPLNPLFQVVSETISDEAAGGLLAGLLALIIAVSQFGRSLVLVDYAWLFLLILFGALIYFSIVLLSVVVCFWWDLPWGLLDITLPIAGLAQYPLDIYSKGVRFLLTWIVPFGFTAFLPAAVFLRPSEYRIFSFIIPLFAITFFALAYSLWKIGLRHYTSSGS